MSSPGAETAAVRPPGDVTLLRNLTALLNTFFQTSDDLTELLFGSSGVWGTGSSQLHPEQKPSRRSSVWARPVTRWAHTRPDLWADQNILGTWTNTHHKQPRHQAPYGTEPAEQQREGSVSDEDGALTSSTFLWWVFFFLICYNFSCYWNPPLRPARCTVTLVFRSVRLLHKLWCDITSQMKVTWLIKLNDWKGEFWALSSRYDKLTPEWADVHRAEAQPNSTFRHQVSQQGFKTTDSFKLWQNRPTPVDSNALKIWAYFNKSWFYQKNVPNEALKDQFTQTTTFSNSVLLFWTFYIVYSCIWMGWMIILWTHLSIFNCFLDFFLQTCR